MEGVEKASLGNKDLQVASTGDSFKSLSADKQGSGSAGGGCMGGGEGF